MQDPFVNIAPKKPNWDLRRDVQKRIEKLERRTQKAIYQLMREYPAHLMGLYLSSYILNNILFVF